MKKSVKIIITLLVLTVSLMSTAFAAENVALKATVTASSEFDAGNAAANAVDGTPVQHGVGEWASAGEVNPWIQLDWSEAVTINKIVFYDRPNTLDNSSSAVITFSDGSTVEIAEIDPEGNASAVEFEPKTVTSIKVQITGSGANNGLAELEVYAADAAPAADNPDTGDMGTIIYVFAALVAAMGIVAVIRNRKLAGQN